MTQENQDPTARWAVEVAGIGTWEITELDPHDPVAATTPVRYAPVLATRLGCSPQDPPTTLHTWLAALHDDDRDRVLAARRKHLATPNEVLTLEYRVVVAEAVQWWQETTQLQPATSAGRWRQRGMVRDVTADHAAKRRAQRQLELMTQTQAAANVGGWELDLVAQKLAWTPETHAIHEVPPGYEPQLATAINFYAPEYVPVITEAVQQCAAGQRFDLELDLITYTGRRIHVHATGHPYYEDGQLTRIYGAFRDITATRLREDELRAQLELIAQQDRAIQAMSTPVIQLWDSIITLPVIGVVTVERATQMMERLLEAITRLRVRYAILDLTGVEEIDTTTADQLLRITHAVNLLGAQVLLCGLTPFVADTLSSLQVDLSRQWTCRNLQEALQRCLRALQGPHAGQR